MDCILGEVWTQLAECAKIAKSRGNAICDCLCEAVPVRNLAWQQDCDFGLPSLLRHPYAARVRILAVHATGPPRARGLFVPPCAGHAGRHDYRMPRGQLLHV